MDKTWIQMQPNPRPLFFLLLTAPYPLHQAALQEDNVRAWGFKKMFKIGKYYY